MAAGGLVCAMRKSALLFACDWRVRACVCAIPFVQHNVRLLLI